MSLQATSLGDLVAATTRDFGEPDFTEIATDLQDHVAMSVMLKPEKMKKFGSGTGLQFNIMVNHNNSAGNSGLYARIVPNAIDTMIQAQVDWRFSRWSYAIERREVSMNRNPRRIVNLIEERRLTGMISWAELMEGNFWRAPSATDPDTPLGVPYWVTKNATAGFTGGILSGFSSVANVSPTTYPRWNNYAFPFTNISVDDFLPAARQAAVKTGFKAPVSGIPNTVTGDSRGYFTNYTVIQKLEDIATSQNENIGPDVTKYDGGVLFRRLPIVWVPLLDNDTTTPFYGLHFGSFKIGYLAGEWQNQVTIPQLDQQPTVSLTVYDSQYNFFCYNRRLNFVGSNGTTYTY